ncbi:hypothetical protein TNCV_3176061 [Trichonephila clavipes]|nr:hypothetical protein TNCV_3176061 [Trichonephila clavipes]
MYICFPGCIYVLAIGHVWDTIRLCLHAKSVDQLRQMIDMEYRDVSQDAIRTFIDSLRRRVHSSIPDRGECASYCDSVSQTVPPPLGMGS